MKKTIAIGLVVVVAGLVSASSPLFTLNFNDADGAASLVNSGTAGGKWTQTKKGSLITEFSPNNTAGLAGRVRGGGVAFSIPLTTYAFPTVQSFTIGGWIYLKGEREREMNIFGNRTTGTGFGILVHGTGRFFLIVEPGLDGSGTAPTSEEIDRLTPNKWMFIAITYDGTKTANNVTYYSAIGTNSLKVGKTVTLNQGDVTPGTNGLGLGIRNIQENAPDMWFDDMRVYISETDETGVLSPSEIQDWMQNSDTDSGAAPGKPIIVGEACPPNFVRTGTYRNI